MKSVLCAVALLAHLLLSLQLNAATTSLPSFNVDESQTSVSGLSSGGFMAVQFEVSYSSIVKGTGVIAGGPYFCAQRTLAKATTTCSCTNPFIPCQVTHGGTNVQQLTKATRRNERDGRIDPTSNLLNHRIFMFSGTEDTVVPQPVMNDLETYYKNFMSGANIKYQKEMAAQHAMPTDSYGNPCDYLGSPFINNCGFDAAGELLRHIYGSLKPKKTGALSGSFIEFDQSEFIADPNAHSMDNTGWVYVPASCQQGHKCRVHIVFHGCQQGYRAVGSTFIENAGYNRWADTNNIIVLYPQVIRKNTFGSLNPFAVFDADNTNPNGCWNWWGYDRDSHYATKAGRQMTAVKAMLDRIVNPSEPPPSQQKCFTATNSEHVHAGRAYHLLFFAFAKGSNQYMGLTGRPVTTTLKQTGPNSYIIDTCR